MPVNKSLPTQDEIKKWFLDVPPVPEGTFEFALVLGGTVSAGAYTAVAVDFLIEALDCFANAKRANRAPRHNVSLKLIAGASGGGVNAAVAARALAYDFPPVSRSTPAGDAGTGNPFYDVWINALRLERFLDSSDIKGDLKSLLNGTPIDVGAEGIIRFGASRAPTAREWVAAPLRVILTVTSLRGVPFKTDLGNGLTQSYVDHADYARFALLYPGQILGEPRPDELVLPFKDERTPQATTWEDFSQFARATAAFPLGFPPQALARPTEHYRWRVVPYPPGPEGASTFLARLPDWQAMVPAGASDVPSDWHFLAVDGGATDNEPIQLARTSLCGLLNRNPRDPKTANRAVWLIDPFAGKAVLGPDAQGDFVTAASAVITTLTQQTRYDSADILMAADDRIFSRFMLTPTRDGLTGADAIASGGLGAFIGFACPAFMRFDYLLGRANCQRFLREQFVLAENNPVFTHWTPDDKSRFRGKVGQGMLPIIPLFDAAAVDETPDPWPKGKLDPERYRSAIEARFRAVLEFELSGDLAKSVLAWVGAHATQKNAAEYIIKAMRASLAKTNLL
ncbi:MAG: patatin-like phospholipase family protein [Pseudomonadota bacterium]|nr:patatin-like phospholipase family protein [Pseudomonadota bacterium]